MRSIPKQLGIVALAALLIIGCTKDDLPLARFPNGNLQLKMMEENIYSSVLASSYYTYDTDGKLIKFTEPKYEINFLYNGSTLISAQQTLWKYDFEYDLQNNVSQIKILKANNLNIYQMESIIKFTYNLDDQLVKEELTYNLTSPVSFKREFNYTYSSQGDLLRFENGYETYSFSYTQIQNKIDATYKPFVLLSRVHGGDFLQIPLVCKWIFSKHLPVSYQIERITPFVRHIEDHEIIYGEMVEGLPLSIKTRMSIKQFDFNNNLLNSRPAQDSLNQKLYFQ